MFVDMHCDTIMALMEHKEKELRENDLMIDVRRLSESKYILQCFAMFVPYRSFEGEENYSPFRMCNKMIDRYYQELDKNLDVMRPAFTTDDIFSNAEHGFVTSLLTIEEGGVLEGNIEYLRNLFRLGVRMMTLTWNFTNEIASPNIDYLKMKKGDPLPTSPELEHGLTEFGIEVVREMNRLGMVIDCSHLGDKGFYDVIKYSTKPIVCSHSCSRSVCNHLRNMTDDMLLKLKENGGVVGINFCHDFVKEDKSEATIKDVVKHINYIRDLIGIDYIGIGSDFDGIGNEDIELKDCSKLPLLVEELIHQGYTNEEINKIMYLNVLRVFRMNF